MPQMVGDKLLNWATVVDDITIEQAKMAARLPFVHGHIALMPDAHYGKGATIGSVIPTDGVIIPSAVGVDVGCGMIAVETNLSQAALPDDLQPFLSAIERAVPAGAGHGHGRELPEALSFMETHNAWVRETLDDRQARKAVDQFGTLGGGNHFFEISIDERGVVWIVMHSGSRGIGNELANVYIDKAKKLAKQWWIPLEDPDLAYLVQGTPEFNEYIQVMQWGQDYAFGSRAAMMNATLRELAVVVPHVEQVNRTNCHHNFAALERHNGRDLWITRKGAIRARHSDLGVIPGSMGGVSYIIQGKGNTSSYDSCAHGAGRAMSRTEARKRFSAEELARQMEGRTWQADKAEALTDEAPLAYKDIAQVMADQEDLVQVVHVLHGIVNYKGTDDLVRRRGKKQRVAAAKL